MLGRVALIEGNYAKVSIMRQEMCGECHACELMGDIKKCEIKCYNHCQSQVGDVVEITIEETRFLKATYLMYGLPLIGLLGGLGIGMLVGMQQVGLMKEMIMIVFGLLGMGGMLWYIKSRDQKQKYKKYIPHIAKIVEKKCES
ncbi:MAG: SoxR reducing system RseC family protein [Cellulosilyticaceae bacterium]